MKRVIELFAIAVAYAILTSCATDIIGGTVADINENSEMTAWQWLVENQPEVAFCFEKGGYKEMLNDPNEDLMVISPNEYSVNRYVRRRNFDYRAGKDGAVEFKIENIEDSVAVQMGMYIYKGAITRENFKVGEYKYLTAIDETTEIMFSLDYSNTDPGCAYDGGNTPGWGFQYSNFLQQTPELFHVLFKRGENWETDMVVRESMGHGNAETDQRYRMMISDVRVKNGVIHVLYMGDLSHMEHYYYHSLFFWGTRDSEI